MTARVRLGVWGAGGRLGQRVVALALADSRVELSRAWLRPGHPRIGQPVADHPDGPRYAADGQGADGCDVVIDVSLAPAVPAHAELCTRLRRPLLVAVTGLTADATRAVQELSQVAAVCVAPNLSTGVWVLAHLARQAAALLPGFDLELHETHHKHKKDAPSGTALMLAGAAAAGRGLALTDVMTTGRAQEPGPRRAGTLGISVSRGGDVVGEHALTLLGEGEQLVLEHRAHNRDTFARGAVELALRLHGRAPGAVDVPALLGLNVR